MSKVKYVVMILFMSMVLFLIPNMSNASVEVDRNVYSSTGSMKFTFTGLELDTTHEYEFGLIKTSASEVEEWNLITDYTETSVGIDLVITDKGIRDVINATDTGYITIRDKNTDSIVLEPYAVDLKMPYLLVTNYTVIENGKELDPYNGINVPLRNDTVSEPYYQYEKITDQKVIDKYKEIKANDGNILEIDALLKKDAPIANWSSWAFWNGYGSDGLNGTGYPERKISVPDEGLYYMWVYFSGTGIKNIYGCILVDNLGNETQSGDNNQNQNNNSVQNNVSNQNVINKNVTVSDDNSIAINKILPKAGKSIIIIALIILFILITMVLYIKNKKYKDIK